MGIGQPDRLHRTKAQGLAAAFGHHLDRQATVEIARRFAFVELGLLGGQQCVDEGLIFRLGHRAVHIGGLFFRRFALVIARLHPGHRHIHAFGIDDGGYGIEEGQRLGPGFGADRLTQRGRGQRTRGDDPVPV